MATANFEFISDASGGDEFTVVGFSGYEAISELYRYEIEVKAPAAAAIDLDDVLDNPVRFVTLLDEEEYPVYGVLSSIDELKTVQGYVHYRAVLVPRLWWLSTYKTNEIYTAEKTVDAIIQLVLENAEFATGTDFDLGGLVTDHLIQRNYRCQFGESDFDFLSRLMENEGIFYYFDHSGAAEKMVFVNDLNYQPITQPDLIFEVDAQAARQHESISGWCCRKQRLPAGITVRDYNPQQPSLDISKSMDIDQMGYGIEYLYGENIETEEEATHLSQIRGEERLCNKTRYYGEGSAALLHAGYTFNLDQHANENYNGFSYLIVEVNHQGEHLDVELSSSGRSKKRRPQYRNSFVAIESSEQFRPARLTPKPHFYGTMTAFIYAETDSAQPEVNEFGEYRVHLPFDRADGTRDSNDPNRKSSAWMRMAQPYVGQDQGLYFPLTGGTEVLLTFINGDPDQPIISAAIPNAAQPSLMEAHPAWSSIVTSLVNSEITGNTHNISSNSDRLDELEGPPSVIPSGVNSHFINDGTVALSGNMIPPWTGEAVSVDPKNISPVYDESLIKFKFYDEEFNAVDMALDHLDKVSTERAGGDNYVYANARTFAYPQHERVYFIGTFHEDFHVKDDFITNYGTEAAPDYNSWTGVKEQFNFPAPGGQFPWVDANDKTKGRQSGANLTDIEANSDGIRGVSEDKRWGDQMLYAWGRSFSWSGGKQMDAGGAFGTFNYGNGYTENLITEKGGTSEDSGFPLKDHKDKMEFDAKNGWSPSDDPFGAYSGWPGYAAKAGGWFNSVAKWLFDYSDKFLHTRHLPTTELRDARRLFPGDTAVEKTFGNTYNYQAGLAVDIHEGHSISRSYGDSEEVVTGDANSVVHGDSYSTKIGNNNGFTLGGSHEIFGGAKSEIMLGWDNEIKVGFDTEIKLSADFTLQVGFETGVQLAGFYKYTGGFGVDRTAGKIRDTSLEMHKKKVALENALTTIEKGELHLMKNQVLINSAVLHLFS